MSSMVTVSGEQYPESWWYLCMYVSDFAGYVSVYVPVAEHSPSPIFWKISGNAADAEYVHDVWTIHQPSYFRTYSDNTFSMLQYASWCTYTLMWK